MKRFLFAHILIILSAAPLFAIAEKGGLAGLENVIPSGAIDAERNPALIPFSPSVSSSALVFIYDKRSISSSGLMYANNSESYSQLDISFKYPKVTAFGGTFAQSWRNDSFGFGASLHQGNDPLYYREKNTLTASSSASEIRSSTTITKISPSLDLSWGFRTGSRSAFGIRSTTSYISNDEEKDETDISGTDTTLIKRKNESTSVSEEVTFGFYKWTDRFEGGLSFSLPSFMYKKTSLKKTSGGVSVGSKDVSQGMFPVNGISFRIGCGIKLTPSLIYCIEIYDVMGMTHNENLIDEDSAIDADKKYKTIKTEINDKYKFIANTGFRFTPSDLFTFYLASAVGFTNSGTNVEGSGSTGERHASNEIRYYLGTAGIELKPAGAVTLAFLGSYARAKAELNMNNKTNDSSYTNLTLKSTLNIINLTAGAALHF